MKSGSSDIIVTFDEKRQFYLSTPFYTTFGLRTILKGDTDIKIKVNGQDNHQTMKIDKAGFIIFSNKRIFRLIIIEYVATSEFLRGLNLKPGKNSIDFKLKYMWFLDKTVSTNIYLFDKNTTFVVSDIDGTVTKSDVLGVIMPLIGKDWTQKGVAKLYNDITSRGYQVIYLSAKTFLAVDNVKWYLDSVNQGNIAFNYHRWI